MADRILAGMLATHRQHESARDARQVDDAAQAADTATRERVRFADLHARILQPIITEHAEQLADAGVTLTANIAPADTSTLIVRIHDGHRPPLDATLRLQVGIMLDADIRVAFDRLLWTAPDAVQWTSSLGDDVVDVWARSMLHGFYRHFLHTTPTPRG